MRWAAVAGGALLGASLLAALGPGLAAAQPDSAERIARGQYLVERANCGECHTPITATGEPDPRYYLAGHVAGGPVPSPTSFKAPHGEGVAYARNLTPDPETGLGRWTLEDFRRAMREGIGRSGQPLNRKMPWSRFNRFFSDADIEAVWLYLGTLPPVRNEVPDSTPFTSRP
jgi:hypothetical protein